MWLAYESYQDNNLDIYIIRVDGSEGPFRLTFSPAPDLDPAWSRAGAGREIAYVSWRDGNQEIYILSLDDPREDTATNVTNSPDLNEEHPIWSPGGLLLAYSAEFEGTSLVYAKPTSDLAANPVVVGQGHDPAWSPDDAEEEDADRQSQLALLISLYSHSPGLPEQIMEPVFEYWEKQIGAGSRSFDDREATFMAMAMTDPHRAADWAIRFNEKLDDELRRRIPQPWEVIGNTLTRDRFSLILMLAAAPLVSLLGLVLANVLGRNPYGFNGGYVPHALTTLFLLVVYGTMVGGLAQMREIVKEQDVYKRERLVNLKIVPYVLSKVWVAGLLSLYTAAAYIIVQYLAFEMPGGPVEFILMYITLVLTSFSGMMLGLFASALSPTPNAAPLIVILLILPQLVLSGALVPLPEAVTTPTATRWGFQALVGIAGIGSSVSADTCWLLPEEQRNLLTAEDKQANCSCLGTNMLKEESCTFPGLGDFYTPAIDQPPPEEPAPLGERPAEPVLPPQPEEPADDADQIAKAEYAAAVQAWLEEVQAIQEQSKAEFDAYEAEAQIFQAQMVEYQSARLEWEGARLAAVNLAEGLVGSVKKDFGWTFVDKDDNVAFGRMIVSTWAAQLIISGVLFVLILLLIKRKDVT